MAKKRKTPQSRSKQVAAKTTAQAAPDPPTPEPPKPAGGGGSGGGGLKGLLGLFADKVFSPIE
jgi:hypothetical protein